MGPLSGLLGHVASDSHSVPAYRVMMTAMVGCAAAGGLVAAPAPWLVVIVGGVLFIIVGWGNQTPIHSDSHSDLWRQQAETRHGGDRAGTDRSRRPHQTEIAA